MWINKIYKLILNLSAVRGTHKVPGQPSPAGHHIHIRCLKADVWCLINQHSAIYTNYGNKKDVGESFSVPIPSIRLSHCPFVRISNWKPAHAVIIYAYTTAWHTPNNTAVRYIYNIPINTQLHIYTTMSVYLFLGIHLIIYIKRGNDCRRKI